MFPPNASCKNCKNCSTYANFGYPGSRPDKCRKHKLINMLCQPTKRCDCIDCKELALYGAGSKPTHCENHKEEHDFNLVERECNNCHLPEVLNKDDLCTNCGDFSRYKKVKELDIKKLLELNEMTYAHDKRLEYTTCNGDRQRPDFLFDCHSHYVVIEVDEDQHSSYSKECEITRMKNLGQQTGGVPMWFIRYNPDKYKNIFGRKRIAGESKHKRWLKLMEWLKYCMKESPINKGDYVRGVYLYYDEWNGTGIEESVELLNEN